MDDKPLEWEVCCTPSPLVRPSGDSMWRGWLTEGCRQGHRDGISHHGALVVSGVLRISKQAASLTCDDGSSLDGDDGCRRIIVGSVRVVEIDLMIQIRAFPQ